MTDWLKAIKWNDDGLVCAIAQDQTSGRILMQAWMNRQALIETADTGYAVYFSRSRKRLWRKGEESGNQQLIKEIRLDCDGDTVVMMVEQIGGIACHTGRESCLFRVLKDGEWNEVDPVLKDPETMYAKP